jgi:hypothetical protein
MRRTLAALAATVLAFAPLPAAAHGPDFTEAEKAWMERQRARDGAKCCNEHDVHVGMVVEWRTRAGRFQVRIAGEWHDVPPGRIMRHDPADPSPFPGQALLFYTPSPWVPNGFTLWCFQPEALM